MTQCEPPSESNAICESPAERILFYDARCLLCHRSIRWIIRRDPKRHFRFASLDSETATRKIPEDHPLRSADTIILLDPDGLHGWSEAVFRVLHQLRTKAKFLLMFSILPQSLTDYAYRLIASHRYKWFGKDDSCPSPDPNETKRFLD